MASKCLFTRLVEIRSLAYEFGITDGYLIFTDTGDKIERAAFTGLFGGSGAVENVLFARLRLAAPLPGMTTEPSIFRQCMTRYGNT